jgi:hypothetical protein
MDLVSLAQALQALGCPSEKCGEMAAQLDKRAAQICSERGGTPEDALAYLIRLMAGGWAAQARGIQLPK